MKLRKTLYINDEPIKLVSEEIRLSLHSPGRAIFQVQSKAPLSGIVRMEIGRASCRERV